MRFFFFLKSARSKGISNAHRWQ